MIEYTVQKSKRKTISLQVKEDGSVLVKAPFRATNAQLQHMVDEHEEWIRQKQQEMETRKESRVEHRFEEGEVFLFLGKELTLAIRHDSYLRKASVAVSEDGTELVVQTPITDSLWIREALVKWYYEQAAQTLAERTKYFAQQMGKRYGRIAIKDQSTRWGSCSRKCNLNYNYRLIMAPPEILDYVVVHELCHLTHMDHSEQFWAAVGEVLPDYKKRRNWLKKNGYLLFAL